MRARSRRGVAVAAGAVVVAVLVALALHVLAARLTRTYVGNQALRRAALFAHRRSPWQWQLHARDDLIAHRVFGPASLANHGHRGLLMTARSHQAYAIGLPLASPADLGRASVLHVQLQASSPLALSIETRSRLDAPLCIARLPDPSRRHSWQLHALTWHHGDGRTCATPLRAAMLRLRFRQSPGSTVLLQRVALRLPPAASTPDLAHAVHLRGPASTVTDRLRHVLRRLPAAAWPLVVVPATHSPQQLLNWRDLALRLSPAAIVLPHGWSPHRQAPLQPETPRHAQWPGVTLYGLALLALLIRRPGGRPGLWLDLAAALSGPLWVIIGLHLGSPMDWLQILPLAMGLAYALLVSLRGSSVGEWRWIGNWRDYPAPLALVGVALLPAAAFGHGWSPLAPAHVLTYLAWALLQQWLMLAFVLRRLEWTIPARAMALIACATIFALLHTPNARLMQLCFAAELYWAWCFTRRRTLLPIALAHAFGALLLQATLTDGWLRSLGISARYFMPS